MLDAALDVRSYVAGRSRGDLDSDSMLRRALVNALQVIGEAAARVTARGGSGSPGCRGGRSWRHDTFWCTCTGE
jgi:uncharacterized protein with HEPN domain